MLPSYETVSDVLSMLVYVLAVCVFSDVALVYLLKKYKPQSKNAYFNFHMRHGFIKIAALKVLVGVLVSYFLLHPPLNGGALAALVLAYILIVAQLFCHFIKKPNGLD